MLILEGSDSLGKTTAAKKLLKMAMEDNKYPVWYAHMSRPAKCFDFFRDYSDMMSKYAIQDRFHLGSLIWHEGVMTRERMRIIEGELAIRGSLTVVLYTSDDEWYSKQLELDKKDQMFDKDKLVAANKFYRSFAEYGEWPVDLYRADIGHGRYLTDAQLRTLLDLWYARLDLLEHR